MDSLFIEYYSLIISTIFYIIYLKFTIFNQSNKKDAAPKTEADSNPDIDEMLHSLKEQLQSISDPTPTISNHVHNKHNVRHMTFNTDSRHASSSSLHPKIKAIPVITEAYNELTTPHKEDTESVNMYYDTLEFEDENEYDSDMLINYDTMKLKLEHDVNNLHSIISDSSSSSIQTASKSNNAPNSSPSNPHIGESGSDDVDLYIQENEFILSEDLNDVHEADEFEMELKDYDVDLSLFPTEEECYPS